MDIRIGKTTVPCSKCGKEYETNVIEGRIVYPRICNDCMKKIVEDWSQKENKE